MRRVAAPPQAMGADVAFNRLDGCLPMRVNGGRLRSVEVTTDAASAQVKSAVLLAGLLARVAATVREPHQSRDHTERMLAARGVEVHVDPETNSVRIPPAQRIAVLDVGVRDRIAAVVAGLRAVGAEADELPDGFVVHGRGPRPLAGRVTTHGDHRLARAFGVLGALPVTRSWWMRPTAWRFFFAATALAGGGRLARLFGGG